jgi:hypothetical protein
MIIQSFRLNAPFWFYHVAKMYRGKTPACPETLSSQTVDLRVVFPRQVVEEAACPFGRRKIELRARIDENVVSATCEPGSCRFGRRAPCNSLTPRGSR